MYVTRPRLVAMLEQTGSCPLVLVSAPAGSGKTSLVADWVAASGDPERTAWITFEAGDDAFWSGVVGCLERLGVPVSPQSVAGSTTTLDRRVLRAVAAAVANQPARLTVVVDGFEVVCAGIADDLDFLIRHSGHRLRLVMVTRADPVLPLYRYRLAETVVEVRMADLAFTDDEAGQLLKASGVKLAPASVHALNVRTKGWVAGLRFAAMTLLHSADPDRAVADVVGDSGNIAEYLMGEVLAVQAPEVRELLLATSIPETIQPGLAEVLGGRSAARTLAFLTRVNVFIEPVPEHPGFYRYHPFFRDLLRAELAYSSPEVMERLQRKAAEWFAHEGLLAASVSHFASINAWEEAAALVVDDLAIGELLLDSGSSALARTMRAIPDELEDPAAIVVRATLALADGDTDRFSEQLAQLPESSDPQPSVHHQAVLLAVSVLQAARARYSADPSGAMVLAESAEQALGLRENRSRSEIHPELAALVFASKGIATWRSGDLVKANEDFKAGAGAAVDAGVEPLLVECLGFLAQIACCWGQLSRAQSLGERAVAIADSIGIPKADRPAAAQVALAWVNMERYDLRAAAEHARLAEQSDFIACDPVVRSFLALVKARLQVAHGDRVSALAGVERATADILDPHSWLVAWLRIEAGHLRVAGGEPAMAMLEIEGIQERHPAEVALVAAMAQLQQGDHGAVEDSLSAVMVKGAPLLVQVSGLLVECARQLRGGSPSRAHAALDRSLRLAAGEVLRRPFHEAPSVVRQLLARDPQLRSEHGWLRNASGGSALRPAAQTPKRPEGEVPADTPVVENLTEKELEVLGHLSELLTTEEIASAMYVSVNTIRTHVRSILRKLGVTRRNAAVRRARELRLLSA